MENVKAMDYLFLSTRVRALETSLLNHDRMSQIMEARSNQEAIQLLQECGYPEMETLNVNTLREALAEEQQKTYEDIASFIPDPSILDVFKVKYDYHNVKVWIKALSLGLDPASLLVDLGRVPVRDLVNKMNTSDLRGLPPILQEAISLAKDTLGTTRDPQLSDFVLDRAYYQDMFQIAKKADSSFLEGYVRISIDAANLRTAIRTMRMGKSAEFLRDILFSGGNMDVNRVLTATAAGGSLAELFALTPLKEAAEAGVSALSGGRLTQFEKLCDNAIMEYLKKAKLVAFGDAPVIAYLAAKDNELTAVRILLTGRLAGIPAETIEERLRESYV